MTAKQVAKLMAEYLGQKDLLQTQALGGEQPQTSEQQEILSNYLTCINDVVQSLAISYFTLKQTQQLSSQNNTFLFSQFEKPLLQVVSVTDLSLNTKIRFKIFKDHFVADSKNVEVLYCYQPAYCQSFDDDLEVCEECVTKRLIALGATARYYLLQGIHAEAVAWNNLFERALLVSEHKNRSLFMHKRSWF